MARHRNVRSMNYSDEYDGYDDVYGHSVEDDFCVSPSEAAFMYDREGSKNQQIGAFIKDIAEEDEQESQLSENETAQLESCIAQLKLVLGSSASKQEMTKILLDNNLNVDKALSVLLDTVSSQPKQTEKKDKDDILYQKPSKQFNIPKLNTFKFKKNEEVMTITENTSVLKLPHSKLNNHVNSQAFLSLSDLSSNHLKNVKSSLNINSIKMDKLFNKLSKNLSDIKLSNKDKTDSPFESVINTNLNVQNNKSCQEGIDLTKALAKNILQKTTVEINKKFDYLNISSEKDLKDDFNCTMDISFILDTTPEISKKVSTFGKILCYKYRKYAPVIVNDKQLFKFSFDVISPDDTIRSYLKT